MQDDSLEASTSISQLLRESYLAETRHRGDHERSRAEPSAHPCHFASVAGAAEAGEGGQEDLPDLSAFLSQEELDESVTLARLAIHHDPGDRAEAAARKRLPEQVRPGAKAGLEPLLRQDGPASPRGSQPEAKKGPPSSESQSKKVFLNKAADFIEELSSLFKAHGSRRLRPRACKGHKGKAEPGPGVPDGRPGLSDRRERSLPISIPADARDNEVNHALECARRREARQEAGEAEVAPASGDTTPGSSPSSSSPHYEEPLGQPPRFTQKLRSREVPEGSRVRLDCVVVGIPPPQVR